MPTITNREEADKRLTAAPGWTEGFQTPQWWARLTRPPTHQSVPATSEEDFERNARDWAEAGLMNPDIQRQLPADIREDLKTKDPLDVLRYAVESGRAADIPYMRDLAGRMARQHQNLPEQGWIAGVGQYIADNPGEMGFLMAGGVLAEAKLLGSAALRVAGGAGIAGRAARIAAAEGVFEAGFALSRGEKKERVRIIAGQDPEKVRTEVAWETLTDIALAAGFGGALQGIGDGLVQVFKKSELKPNTRAAVMANAVRLGMDAAEAEKLLEKGVPAYVGRAVSMAGARDGHAFVPVSPEEAAKLTEQGFVVGGKGKKRFLSVGSEGTDGALQSLIGTDAAGMARRLADESAMRGVGGSAPKPRVTPNVHRVLKDAAEVEAQVKEDLQIIGAADIERMGEEVADVKLRIQREKDADARKTLERDLRVKEEQRAAGAEVLRRREAGEDAEPLISAIGSRKFAEVWLAGMEAQAPVKLNAKAAEAEIQKRQAGESANREIVRQFIADYIRQGGDASRMTEFEQFWDAPIQAEGGNVRPQPDYSVADLPEELATIRERELADASADVWITEKELEFAMANRTQDAPPLSAPVPPAPKRKPAQGNTEPVFAPDEAFADDVRAIAKENGLDEGGTLALRRVIADVKTWGELVRVAKWRERYYQRLQEIGSNSPRVDRFFAARNSVRGADIVDNQVIRELRDNPDAGDEFIDALIQKHSPLVRTIADDGEVTWKVRVRYSDGTNKAVPFGAEEGDFKALTWAEREAMGDVEGFEDIAPGGVTQKRVRKQRGQGFRGANEYGGVGKLINNVKTALGVSAEEANILIAVRRMVSDWDNQPFLRGMEMGIPAKPADLGKRLGNNAENVTRTRAEVGGKPVYLYKKRGKDADFWEAAHNGEPITENGVAIRGRSVEDLRLQVYGWFDKNKPDIQGDSAGIQSPIPQQPRPARPVLHYVGKDAEFLIAPTAGKEGDIQPVFTMHGGQRLYNTTGGLWIETGNGKMRFTGEARADGRWAFSEPAPEVKYRDIPRDTPEQAMLNARADNPNLDPADFNWWKISEGEWRRKTVEFCVTGRKGV